MRKGQIVRRMLNNGTPVGPYMVIRGFISNHVLTQKCEVGMVFKNTASLYYAKSHIYEPRMVKLVVQDAIWERIELGKQMSIIHDPTPMWEKMIDIQPEVVQIRSRKYSQKVMIFTVDQISEHWYSGGLKIYHRASRQIRLDLGYRLL